MNHILSYGGGVNSTALAIEMIRRDMPFVAVFADPGSEHQETYEYVELFRAWLSDHGREMHTVTNTTNGPMYEHMMAKKTIPHIAFRDCTDKWKIRPITKWIVQQYGENPITEYIGIDAGEAHRTLNRKPKRSNITTRFPLVEWDIDRDGCVEIIKSAGLPIPRKSGCYFCPFQRVSQWKKLAQEQPELFKRAVELEENHASGMTLIPGRKLRDLLAKFDADDKQLDFIEPPCGCYDGIL